MPIRRDELDSVVRIVTPENIAFEYRLAGPFWRLPAYAVDLLIRAGLLASFILIGLAAGFTVGPGLAVFLILVAWFVLEWFYGGLFETFWNGQTPGKRLFRLRVISVDGQPIDALQAVLRNVLRTVDASPAFALGDIYLPTFVLGLVSTAVSRRYQRLGDLACGTIVVVEEAERLRGVVEVNEPRVHAVATMIPPDFVVSRSLAAALSKYLERRKYFGPARRAEIARHVGEVLADRLRLPADVDYDALLCALYQRAFVTERIEEAAWSGATVAKAIAAPAQSPFAKTT